MRGTFAAAATVADDAIAAGVQKEIEDLSMKFNQTLTPFLNFSHFLPLLTKFFVTKSPFYWTLIYFFTNVFCCTFFTNRIIAYFIIRDYV